jgi:hypothetical protein
MSNEASEKDLESCRGNAPTGDSPTGRQATRSDRPSNCRLDGHIWVEGYTRSTRRCLWCGTFERLDLSSEESSTPAATSRKQ